MKRIIPAIDVPLGAPVQDARQCTIPAINIPNRAPVQDERAAAPPTQGSAQQPASKQTESDAYLPDDVQRATLRLALDREKHRGVFVKLQAPKVSADPDRRAGLLDLPEDVYGLIIPKINRMLVKGLSTSCRQGYLTVESMHPVHRLPGLLHDLGKLSVNKCQIMPASLDAFLQAISTGGSYDRVLLTPLSPAIRCAASVAVALWALPRLPKKQLQAMEIKIRRFFAENYRPGFLDGINAILDLHLGIGVKLGYSDYPFWNDLFEREQLNAETKARIFEKLLYRTEFHTHWNRAKVIKGASERLDYLAHTYSLKLRAPALGILVLISKKVEDRYSQKFKEELKKLTPGERDNELNELIGLRRSELKKINVVAYLRTLLPFFECADGNSRINPFLLPHIVEALKEIRFSTSWNVDLTSENKYKDYQLCTSFDTLLFSETEGSHKELGRFTHLLINELSTPGGHPDAEKLLRKIMSIINSNTYPCPVAISYIEMKIAALH